MSQAPQTHTQSQSQASTPDPKLGAMAERLEKLRQRLATTLDEDALADLQAAVVELASLAGKPPGLAQPVPTPAPAPDAPHPGAPTPPAPPR